MHFMKMLRSVLTDDIQDEVEHDRANEVDGLQAESPGELADFTWDEETAVSDDYFRLLLDNRKTPMDFCNFSLNN